MRLNRRFFQYLVGGAFAAAAVSIEAVESFRVLRETVPARWAGMFSQLDILLLFFVGILFLWLGKNEHREESETRSSRAADLPLISNTAVTHADPLVSPTITVSPTINASPKVEIHNHPPTASSPKRSVARPDYAEPKHNVTFLGPTPYQLSRHGHLFNEISDNDLRCILAEFRNQSIPGGRTASFSYVSADISFRDVSKKEVQHASPCLWAGHPGPSVNIVPGGESVWVVVALYSDTRNWLVGTVQEYKDYTLDVFGIDSYRYLEKTLPFGRLVAKIGLTDGNGESVPPVIVDVELGPRGSYRIFKPQSPE